MITDSQNITWTSNTERSEWTASDGRKVIVNPESTDEQVLNTINVMYASPLPLDPQTAAARVAELEADLAALKAKLLS